MPTQQCDATNNCYIPHLCLNVVLVTTNLVCFVQIAASSCPAIEFPVVGACIIMIALGSIHRTESGGQHRGSI